MLGLKKAFFVALFSGMLVFYCFSLAWSQELLTLEEAVNKAISHAKEVLNAQDKYQLAQLDLEISKSTDFSPAVEVEGFVPLCGDAQSSVALSISDTVYLKGASKEERLAQLALQNTQDELIKTQEEIKIQTISTYCSLLQAQEELKLIQKNLELARKLYEDGKLRFEQGNISHSSLLELEEGVKEKENLLAQHKKYIVSLIRKLNLLLGNPLDTSFQLAPLPDFENLPHPGFDEVVDSKLTISTEKKTLLREKESYQIELEELAKQKKVGVSLFAEYQEENASFNAYLNWPDWVLEYQLQLGSSSTQSFFQSASSDVSLGEDGSWTVGIEFSFPLFDGGVTDKKEKQIRLSLNILERNLEGWEKEALLEVDAQYQKFIQAENAFLLSRISLKNAKETYQVFKKQFELGAITDRELLQGEVQLVGAQSDYQKNKIDYFLNWVQLLVQSEKPLNIEQVMQQLAVTR
jgi:outer membrane protein TolC